MFGIKYAIIACLAASSLVLEKDQSSAIQVSDLKIKIGSLKTERLFYAFAKGDKIQLNLEVLDGKELKEVEIYQYPNHSLFMDYETISCTNNLIANETGIYVVRLKNASMAKRVCQMSLSRTPSHDSLSKFNTQVYWKVLYDTIQYPVKENVLIRSGHVAKTIQAPQKFYVNSGSNSLLLGGSSRITVPVQLPPNTVEWYYIFSADRNEEQIQRTTKSFDLLGDLTRLIDATGSLDFAISAITKPPGGDACDIYLLDYDNVNKFENKVAYSYYRDGSRENLSSGVINLKNYDVGKYYVGIKNPDATQGVHVSLEVAAIVYEEIWEEQEIIKYVPVPRKEPYILDK